MQQVNHYIELGNQCFIKGDHDRALKYYRRALTIDNTCAVAYYNIANILASQSRFEPAERHYRQALKAAPDWPEALNNLANVLKEFGRNSEAEKCYIKALALNPLLSEAHNGLGNIYQSEGKIDRAIYHYKRALEINPDYAVAHSNMLLSLNYSADYSPQEVFDEHKRYGNRYKQSKGAPIPINRQTGMLRIGYISPDFRRHSVGYFIAPVLECHDHNRFCINCYSDVASPDALTERLKGYVDKWIDSRLMTDEELYHKIRDDGIDILIDLAGHSGYNRLGVFALKAAPVQITWLGYPNTSGLSSIDYRIVDHFTDPEGLTDRFNIERLLRLSGCFLCFEPPKNAPPVHYTPSIDNGYTTFGSLNNLAKLNDQTLDLWAEILQKIGGSKLLIKSKVLNDPLVRQGLIERFTIRGIEPNRLELIGFVRDFKGHLDIYNRIDIALDPFPYNGTTTTFEALYMGVPVITLGGNTHASRVGMSILSNLGLSELIATSKGQYIDIASSLASRPHHLNALRFAMRDRMLHSRLVDKVAFTREIESLLLRRD